MKIFDNVFPVILLLIIIVLVVIAFVVPGENIPLGNNHYHVYPWEDNRVTCRVLTPSISGFRAGLNGIAISCMLKKHSQGTPLDSLTFPRAMESSL